MTMDVIARGMAIDFKVKGQWASSRGTFYVAEAKPGVDAYDLIIEQVQKAIAAGGGTIVLPRIGGVGYYIRDTIVIRNNNIIIEYDDNVKVTRTDPALTLPSAGWTPDGLGVFHFIGDLWSAAKAYLKGCGLIARRENLILDGNGTAAKAASGYVYNLNGFYNQTVLFQGVEGPQIINVTAMNGLMGNITTSFSPNGKIMFPQAYNAVYDNGLYIYGNAEQLRPFSETDPRTWNKTVVVGARASGNRNHGLGVYGAVGTVWLDPEWWDNGNNLPDTGDYAAGPAGGFGIERANGQPDRNYRTTLINPRGNNSYGFILRSNCKGTQVFGGRLANAKIPTAVADDPSVPIWGSSVFAQDSATYEFTGTDIDGSERTGIRMQGSAGYYPKVKFDGGYIRNCVGRAVWALGYEEFISNPTTIIRNNGDPANTTAGSVRVMEFNNSVAGINQGQGKIYAAGVFEDNQSGLITVSGGCAEAHLLNIRSSRNALAWSSAQHLIYLAGTIGLLEASEITNHDPNSKISRILKVDNATKAIVDRKTIIGDQTSKQPRAEVTATTLIGGPPESYVDQTYAAIVTPNPRSNGNMNVTLSGDMTIAAPSVTPAAGPPEAGDRFTIVFTKDANTTVRTITWNAAWKGATLAATPATASVKARATFEFDGSNYVQVSSTGWYS